MPPPGWPSFAPQPGYAPPPGYAPSPGYAASPGYAPLPGNPSPAYAMSPYGWSPRAHRAFSGGSLALAILVGFIVLLIGVFALGFGSGQPVFFTSLGVFAIVQGIRFITIPDGRTARRVVGGSIALGTSGLGSLLLIVHAILVIAVMASGPQTANPGDTLPQAGSYSSATPSPLITYSASLPAAMPAPATASAAFGDLSETEAQIQQGLASDQSQLAMQQPLQFRSDGAVVTTDGDIVGRIPSWADLFYDDNPTTHQWVLELSDSRFNTGALYRSTTNIVSPIIPSQFTSTVTPGDFVVRRAATTAG